jgi:YlmC/YmxH family sporulation protein
VGLIFYYSAYIIKKVLGDIFMYCKIGELKDKQVVSVKDGSLLGYVSDVELDVENGKLISIILPGKNRGFGLLGREEDIIIPWNNISVIGNDSILVNSEGVIYSNPKKKKYGLYNY